MFLKICYLFAVISSGSGLLVSNNVSNFQNNNEFPTKLYKIIEEYDSQPSVDIVRVNKKFHSIMNNILKDPEISFYLKDANLQLLQVYDKIGFSAISLLSSIDPKIGPVDNFEFGLKYSNRPTLILIDKLHSLSIKYKINDSVFHSIKKYLEFYKTDIIDSLNDSIDDKEPLAELVLSIYLSYINSNTFDDMISHLEPDLKKFSNEINAWIDHQTESLANNSSILTHLAIFIRKLTTHFSIKVIKPGFINHEKAIYAKANGNILVANGKIWMKWRESSLDGEIMLSTRSGLAGMLIDQINKQDFEESDSYRGVKEFLFLGLKWIENLTEDQEKEVTENLKINFLEWAKYNQDETAS